MGEVMKVWSWIVLEGVGVKVGVVMLEMENG